MRTLAALLCLVLVGCGLTRAPVDYEAPYAPDPVLTVEVDNRNFYTVSVKLYRAAGSRVGSVFSTPNRISRETFTGNDLGHTSLVVVVDPVGDDPYRIPGWFALGRLPAALCVTIQPTYTQSHAKTITC